MDQLVDDFKSCPKSEASMAFASDLLYGFDVEDKESLDFLKSLIVSGHVPKAELREAIRLSILHGQEEWDMICSCARSIWQRSVQHDRRAADPGVVPYLAYVLASPAERDDLAVALRKDRANRKQKKKRELRRATSQFWDNGRRSQKVGKGPNGREEGLDDRDARATITTPLKKRHGLVQHSDTLLPCLRVDPSLLLEHASPAADDKTIKSERCIPSPSPSRFSSPPTPLSPPVCPPTPRARASFKSPFFTSSTTTKKQRPPRGTISSLPFPSLSSPAFGLIQESLAHDSFCLLVAVTFLIRTTGKAAIPMFHSVMERFPTPETLLSTTVAVEPDGVAELVPMIAHLGLPRVRCAAIRKYARGWIETPPVPGVKFDVKGYPRQTPVEWAIKPEAKATGSDEGDGKEKEKAHRQNDVDSDSESKPATPGQKERCKSKAISSQWEIGHLTQGRYAIDSWRIFCRDIFLGRSEDWKGPPLEPQRHDSDEETAFEPEWKRVLPDDKELRACLRWMWMREGFEWDPLTGRKTPLREEMRAAVEDGRVGYDDAGGLVILDQPLDGLDAGYEC